MYEAPQVVDLGSVEELTEKPPKFNKVGPSPDASRSNPVVGSLVPFP